MNNTRYDSYCGLYCGACEILNAQTEKDKERVINIFGNGIPGWQATPEQIKCSGCKTDDAFVNCRMCLIRPCAKDKGVEFCIECNDFPCNIYEQGKLLFEQIQCLRHTGACLKNMKYIKSNSLEKWLEDQAKRWKCPECNTGFSWYTDECTVCKKNLLGIKDYENLKDSDMNTF